MSDTQNLQVLIAVYPTVDGAKNTLKTIKELQSQDVLDLVDAATLVKDADGKVTADEVHLPHPKSAGIKGAVIGGVIGVIFPPSILAGVLVGAGLGAGAGAVGHKAKLSPDLTEAANELAPGTSALMAVMQDRVVQQFLEGVQGYTKLAQSTLDADAVAALSAEVAGS
jgi:uncharacterized membrane protein